MNILVLNGPNLNLLGTREPGLYGTQSLDALIAGLRERAGALGVGLAHVQSQAEGDLVAEIVGSRGVYDGLILNPAAYTHTSLALRDALQAVPVPCVEVHLSNTAAREPVRQVSLTAGACLGQIMGFGALGYHLALIGLVEYLKTRRATA